MTTIGLPSSGRPATAGQPRQAAATGTDAHQPAVLDPRILERLGAELRSQEGALQFAELFGKMLPQRIRAVETAFAAHDADSAVVALLSLRASASMVGALRLEQAASWALGLLEDPSAHPALTLQLQRLGTECQSALGGIIR